MCLALEHLNQLKPPTETCKPRTRARVVTVAAGVGVAEPGGARRAAGAPLVGVDLVRQLLHALTQVTNLRAGWIETIQTAAMVIYVE